MFGEQLIKETTSLFASEVDVSEGFSGMEEMENEGRCAMEKSVTNPMPKVPSSVPSPPLDDPMEFIEIDTQASVNAQAVIRSFEQLDKLSPWPGEVAKQLGHTHLDKTNQKICFEPKQHLHMSKPFAPN